MIEPQDSARKNEANALLKLMSFAEEDIKKGRVLTSEELDKRTEAEFLKKWSQSN